MSAFDSVKYDKDSADQSAKFKAKFIELETMVNGLREGRPRSVAMTKLEEANMWIGKAIRDKQIATTPESDLK